MALTDSEKQEIVNSVLSSLSTNATTIDQMIETEECSDDLYFETNKGSKISFGTVREHFDAKITQSKSELQSNINATNENVSELSTTSKEHTNNIKELKNKDSEIVQKISGIESNIDNIEKQISDSIEVIKSTTEIII